MAISDQLDCNIYAQSDSSIGDLARLVADSVGGTLSRPAFGMIVTAPGCEIEVRGNPDRQEIVPSGEDGFLFFKFVLECYPDTECPRKDMIDLVGKLLTQFWSRGWPAVAACDYEADPPHGGGYRSMPWLKAPIATAAQG